LFLQVIDQLRSVTEVTESEQPATGHQNEFKKAVAGFDAYSALLKAYGPPLIANFASFH
jgi:hypothetical protein